VVQAGQPNDLPLRVKLTQEQKGGGKPVVIYGSTGVRSGLTIRPLER
jgi:hypothetical protein